MIFEDAYEAAKREVGRIQSTQELIIVSCDAYPEAWVFGYNSRRFMETFEISYALAGNAPIIVPTSDEDLFFADPSLSIEDQIRQRWPDGPRETWSDRRERAALDELDSDVDER